MTVKTEYVIETVDDYGDILDCQHFDTLKDARKHEADTTPNHGCKYMLAKVSHKVILDQHGNPIDEHDRQYTYL